MISLFHHTPPSDLVSHYGFSDSSLTTSGGVHLPFDVLIGHLYIFFGEMSVQILCPFLNWATVFLLLSCNYSLYILDTSPLSDR